ncbi:MAG: hypothetical protein AB7P34_01395 [Vicinamibacterales bacterium]
MNRRQFVSRVSLGAAAVCTPLAHSSFAATAAGQVNVRFVGMMTFLERADRSFLVATPGHHAFHHMTHTPFLMARKGSAIAKALGMVTVPGVIPAAFDTSLIGSNPTEFVFLNLDNTAVDIISGAEAPVMNSAREMAVLNKIAPGKRVRGNVEKWAAATISLRGGRIEDSAGHPDAGKVWAFGNYKQRLTDAVNFKNNAGAVTSIRLTSAVDARSFTVPAGELTELWVFSAAEPNGGIEPTQLEHSEVLFDYLVDANPIVATCPDATGRKVPDTKLPFASGTSASMGIIAGRMVSPPLSEFCFIAAVLQELLGVKKD